MVNHVTDVGGLCLQAECHQCHVHANTRLTCKHGSETGKNKQTKRQAFLSISYFLREFIYFLLSFHNGINNNDKNNKNNKNKFILLKFQLLQMFIRTSCSQFQKTKFFKHIS